MNKAISIKQPWAYLICAGIKDVENRTWPTKYRGRVYIHASAKPVGQYFSEGVFTADQLNYLIQSKKINLIEKVQLSAIIGHIDIVDCVINHDSIWAERSIIHQANESDPDTEDDLIIYNWVLSNPVLFDKPILNVKGKLSFWDCSEYLVPTNKI
ncbi:ASCH domain-containing protein [Dysgonomonas sp. 37-18]|uniref:ASCH domain-containing protein n=1 Tax=Dysgonomonas sp. 37-18 TaxID=1895907 RepID=UPI00092A670F|nr:ASCH domain-containing protein [Dysgonomonas sp. 37-18]OJX63098.1 MAG: hypothetical protein BGO84_14435 [Dysgonomonas sp. 37-18]